MWKGKNKMNQFQEMQEWLDMIEEEAFSVIAEGLVPDLDAAQILHILNFRMAMEEKSSVWNKTKLSLVSENNKGE